MAGGRIVSIRGDRFSLDKSSTPRKLQFHYYLFIDALIRGKVKEAYARLKLIMKFFDPYDSPRKPWEFEKTLPLLPVWKELTEAEQNACVHIKRKARLFILVFVDIPGCDFYKITDREKRLADIKTFLNDIPDPCEREQCRKIVEIVDGILSLPEYKETTQDEKLHLLSVVAKSELLFLHFYGDFLDGLKRLLPPLVKTSYPYTEDVAALEKELSRKEIIQISTHHHEKYIDGLDFIMALWNYRKVIPEHDYIKVIYSLMVVIFERVQVKDVLNLPVMEKNIFVLNKLLALARGMLVALNESDKFKQETLTYHDFMLHQQLLQLIFEVSLSLTDTKKRAGGKYKNDDSLNLVAFSLYRDHAYQFEKSCPRIAITFAKRALKLARAIPGLYDEVSKLLFLLATKYGNIGLFNKAITTYQLHIEHAGENKNKSADSLLAEARRVRAGLTGILGGDLAGEFELLRTDLVDYEDDLLSSRLARTTPPIVTLPKVSDIIENAVCQLDKMFERFGKDYFPSLQNLNDFIIYMISRSLHSRKNVFLLKQVDTPAIVDPGDSLVSALQGIGLIGADLMLDVARVSKLELDAELRKLISLDATWAIHIPIIKKLLLFVIRSGKNVKIEKKYLFKVLGMLDICFHKYPTASDFKEALAVGLRNVHVLIYSYRRSDANITEVLKQKSWLPHTDEITRIITDPSYDPNTVEIGMRDLERRILAPLAADLSTAMQQDREFYDDNTTKWITRFVDKYKAYLPYKSQLRALIAKTVINPDFDHNDQAYLERSIAGKIKPQIMDDLRSLFEVSVSIDSTDLERKLASLDPALTANGNLAVINEMLTTFTGEFIAKKKYDSKFRLTTWLNLETIINKLLKNGWLVLKEYGDEKICVLTQSYNPDSKEFEDEFMVPTADPDLSFSIAPIVRRMIDGALARLEETATQTSLPTLAFRAILCMQPFNRETETSAFIRKLSRTWSRLNATAIYSKHSGPVVFPESQDSLLARGSYRIDLNLIALRPDYEVDDLLPYLEDANNEFPKPLAKDQLIVLATSIIGMLKEKYLKTEVANDGTGMQYDVIVCDELTAILSDDCKNPAELFDRYRAKLLVNLQNAIPASLKSAVDLTSLNTYVGNFLYVRKSQDLGFVDKPDATVDIDNFLHNAVLLVSAVGDAFYPFRHLFQSSDLAAQGATQLLVHRTPFKKSKPLKQSFDIARKMFVNCHTASDYRVADRKFRDYIAQILKLDEIELATNICGQMGRTMARTYPPLAYKYFKMAQVQARSVLDDFVCETDAARLLLTHCVDFERIKTLELAPPFDLSGGKYESENTFRIPTNSFLAADLGEHPEHNKLKVSFEYIWMSIFKLYRDTLLFDAQDSSEIARIFSKCNKIAKRLRTLLDNVYTGFVRQYHHTPQGKFPSAKQEVVFLEYLTRDGLEIEELRRLNPAAFNMLCEAQSYCMSNHEAWRYDGHHILETLVLITNKAKHSQQPTSSSEDLINWQNAHAKELHSQFYLSLKIDEKVFRISAVPFLFKSLLCTARLMNALLSKGVQLKDELSLDPEIFAWAFPAGEMKFAASVECAKPEPKDGKAKPLTTAIQQTLIPPQRVPGSLPPQPSSPQLLLAPTRR